MQEKDFALTKTLLFDGESSLRSKAAQKTIKEQLDIVVHADSYFKRTMAERAVREFKLRMTVCLNHKKSPAGINFKLWKNKVQFVVDTINASKPFYRSKTALLTAYFTQAPTPSLPQKQPFMYRFSLGERVRFFLSKAERKNLGFKYSLSFGK